MRWPSLSGESSRSHGRNRQDIASNFREARYQPRLFHWSASPSNVKRRARRYALWICHSILANLVLLSLLPTARAQSGLPDGPGRAVVERMCTTCHGLNVVTGQRMTKQHWADQVDDMVSRGAVGSDADIRTGGPPNTSPGILARANLRPTTGGNQQPRRREASLRLHHRPQPMQGRVRSGTALRRGLPSIGS